MTTGKNEYSKLNRRQFLNTAGVAAVAAGGLSIAGTAARAQTGRFAGKQVRVLTWADATGKAAVRNIMKPFEDATGAKVIADLTGTTSEMVAKIKASANRPQHDVVILSGVGAIELAKSGLLAQPNLDKIPNLQQVFPDYRTGANGFGIGYFLWSDGMVFSTKTYSTPPTSYEALWNEKSAGRIFVPPANNLGAMELIIAAARLGGGSQTNPDAGFELLRKLKSRVLTISSNAGQLAELFRAGSLDAGAVYSPLEMADFIPKPEYNLSGTYDLKEGFFTDLQFMVIPKGHPGDADAAHALINQALDPVSQAKMAEDVWYGPINKETKLSAAAQNSPYIASPQVIASKVTKIDLNHLAGARAEWTKRYTEALTG